MPDINCRYGVVLIGPFVPDNHYKVSVDGYLVPHILVYEGERFFQDFVSVPDPSKWCVRLDGRMDWNVPKEECGAWFALMANAMAVAAGRSCFGPHARPKDPFDIKIGPLPDDPAPNTPSS